MPYTDLLEENPFAPILPLEIWLMINKYKKEMEYQEKLLKIQSLDKLIRHNRTRWKSPYSTNKRRREAKREYKLLCEERERIINE